MPRNPGTGIYTKPYPDVISDTTIESTVHNGEIADIETDLNTPRPIVAGGTGANNVAQARSNLKAEVAGTQVLNYDSHVFENGSFYSNNGATGQPAARYFVGTARLLGSDPAQYQTIEVHSSDGTNPQVAYRRQKIAGVWQAWTSLGLVDNGYGASYIGSETADMSFGLGGTAPNSFFFINSEGDVSGSNIITASKQGVVSISGQPYLQVHYNSTYPNSVDQFFSTSGANRWLIRVDGPTATYQIYRYDASQNVVDAPFQLNWGSGLISVKEPVDGVHIATKNYVDTTKVSKSGDTMTGNLGINGADAYLTLNSTTGSTANIAFGRNSNWCIRTGIDTVGDFFIDRFNDAGAPIGTSLQINRSTGQVTVSNALNVSNGNNLTILGGDIYIRSPASGSSRLILNDEAAGYRAQLTWDRANVFLASALGAQIVLQGGSVALHNGWVGKQGTSGPSTGNANNMFWNTTAMQLWVDNSNIGNITVTSDYRIKKDVADLSSMWATVKALRPVSYTQAQYTPQIEVEYRLKEAARERAQAEKDGTPKPVEEIKPMFVADDIERWGFIAHELQATTVESAATGVKDDPVHVQSLNLAPIVAALTKALQEAMARIEALEAAQAPT